MDGCKVDILDIFKCTAAELSLSLDVYLQPYHLSSIHFNCLEKLHQIYQSSQFQSNMHI